MTREAGGYVQDGIPKLWILGSRLRNPSMGDPTC
jgi:hypothetical protein